MDLNSVLNLKDQMCANNQLPRKSFDPKRSVSDSDAFSKLVLMGKADGDSIHVESRSLQAGHSPSRYKDDDAENREPMIAETEESKKDIEVSSHASSRKDTLNGRDNKSIDPILSELILAQQDLSSKGSKSELKDHVSGNTGSKGVGESDYSVHGGALQASLGSALKMHMATSNKEVLKTKERLVERQRGENQLSPILKNHETVGNDLIYRPSNETHDLKNKHSDERSFHSSELKVATHKSNQSAVVNTSIQNYLGTTTDSSHTRQDDEYDLEFIGGGVNSSSRSYLNSEVAPHATMRGSIDVSKFNSFLIDEIKTARELGELKREMTVNIRPSMFGDISITITNGADGCLVSLVTTSQAATNYLSLLKRDIEKSSNAKVSIGSAMVDSKGNLSVVNFKKDKSQKEQ